MSFFQCKHFSYVLGMPMPLSVIVPQRQMIGGPESGPGTSIDCPVLYLLHGLSEDESSWYRFSPIEQLATDFGIAVVMPRAERSFYTNMKHGPHYWSYVSRELPRFISDTFRFSSDSKCKFVAGNSMGGFGALKLAFNKPSSFAAVGAFSPVVQPDPPAPDAPDYVRTDRENIFGKSGAAIGTNDDLRFSAKSSLEKFGKLPDIFISCGLSDDLLHANNKFHEDLISMGVDHHFSTDVGIHDRNFWNKSLSLFFKFLKDKSYI